MNRLAARLEHRRDRILGQPADLEIRPLRAQGVGDGDVAQRVAKADRARKNSARRRRAIGGSMAAEAAGSAIDELTDQQVERLGHARSGCDQSPPSRPERAPAIASAPRVATRGR